MTRVVKYKEFTLDPFQVEAVDSIEKNHSVVVSAATGTGKTLIADYIIDKSIKEGKRVIFTAPIKALSNQKYRDFKEAYGDHVGLLTGDVSINERAQVLVMTTEIYRNMLMTRDECVQDIAYVIFDEIHFINDPERGTVWEESIIFSPPFVRFLCLSATIPNAEQFAQWISSTNDHQVDVVRYSKRAVPLQHYAYEKLWGLFDVEKLPEMKELDQYPNYKDVYRKRGRRSRSRDYTVASHLEIVDLIQDNKLPCIFFVFSRKASFEKAMECAKKYQFTTSQEKNEIITIFNKVVPSEVRSLDSAQVIKRMLTKGVGVHNAGILPHLKEVVEVLFNKGLLKVLYATETFAVGINMPARCVCFNSMQKYDGISFRYLHTKEYFQMAGRAGRRGIDTEGHVIILVDRARMDLEKVFEITRDDLEPIVSQFKVSYNTVLNLKKHYNEETIEKLLKSNFGYFVKKMSKKQIRIMSTYRNMVRTLEKYGYISDGHLTEKGEFAARIYSNELLVSELVFARVFHELPMHEVNVLAGVLAYEARKSDSFKLKKNVGPFMKTINQCDIVRKKIKITDVKRVYLLFSKWSQGCEFEELLDLCSLDEGHIVRLIRQAIDALKQIRKASTDQELVEKISQCISLLDRDMIEVKM